MRGVTFGNREFLRKKDTPLKTGWVAGDQPGQAQKAGANISITKIMGKLMRFAFGLAGMLCISIVISCGKEDAGL